MKVSLAISFLLKLKKERLKEEILEQQLPTLCWMGNILRKMNFCVIHKSKTVNGMDNKWKALAQTVNYTIYTKAQMDMSKSGVNHNYVYRKLSFLFNFLYLFINLFWYRSILVPGTSLINNGALGFFYMIGLGYLFFGIAIISDIFMESIESITA